MATVFTGGCGTEEGDKGSENAADASDALTRATSYEKQGQYRAALIELRKAGQAGLDPQAIAVRHAQILNDLGQYRGVVTALEQVDPGNRSSEAEELLLKALIATRKLASAERLLTASTKISKDVEAKSRADIDLIRGDFASARMKYEQIVKDHPENVDAQLGLASTEASLGDKDRSGERIKKLVADHPKHVLARIAVARLYFDAEQYPEAEDMLSNILIDLPQTDIMKPEKAVVLNLLIETLTRQGRTSEALVYTQSLAEENPESSDLKLQFSEAMSAWEAGELEQAYEQFSKLYEQAPSDVTGTMLGIISYTQGKPEEAAQYFERHTDPETASAGVLDIMSRTLAREGRLDEAMAAVQKARENAPNNSSIKGLEGLLILASGDESGKKLMEESLAENPKQLQLWIGLSRHAAGKNEFAAAEKLILSGLEQFPKDFTLRRSLIGIKLAQKQTAAAEKLIATWLKEDPSDGGVLLLQGDVAVLHERWEEAKASYLKGMDDASPSKVKAARNGLITVAMRQKNYKEAEKLSLEAITINPGDSVSYKLWVNALEAQGGQTPDTIEAALKGAAKENNSVTATLVLVEYFFRQNLLERAREALAFAREQAPALASLNNIEAAIAYQEARTAFADKDYVTAREHLVNALLKQPDNVNLSQFLVRVELQDNNFREAEKLISRMKVEPKYGSLISELRGELAAAKGDYPSAETLFTEVWRSNPSEAVAHNLYRAIKAQGKPVMAFLDDWKAKNGSFSADLFIAGEYLDQGDYQKAAKLYEPLAKSRPDHPMVLNNLAWSYHMLKDKRALGLAQKAVEIAGDSAPILDTLGVILLAEGKNQEALKTLQKANEIAPEAEDIKEHLEQARARN